MPSPRAGNARDHLALERTLLAWVRTGIALIGLGIVLAKFGVVLARIGLGGVGGTGRLGAGLVVAGGAVAALAGARYWQGAARLRAGRPPSGNPLPALLVAGVVVAVALYAALLIF